MVPLNRQHASASGRLPRGYLAEALLVGGAIATWLVALLLSRDVAPEVLADTTAGAAPAMAAEAVRGAARAGQFVGAALFLGGLAAVAPPANLVARVWLLVVGIAAAVQGLMLLSGGATFLSHGPGMRTAAVAMVVGGAVDVAVGVLASAIAVSRLLPGQSLVERMMQRDRVPLASADRARLRALIGVVLVAWVALTLLALATMSPAGHSTALNDIFQIGQLLVLPLLAGAVVAGWRQASPNRLLTLGLTAGAGLAVNWLFFLAAILWNLLGFAGSGTGVGDVDVDAPVWMGILDAVLGAAGGGLWASLASRGPSADPHPG